MFTLIVIGTVACLSGAGGVAAMKHGKRAKSVLLLLVAAVAVGGMMLAHSNQEDCKRAAFRTSWCG